MAKYRKRIVVFDAFCIGIDPMPDWFMEEVRNETLIGEIRGRTGDFMISVNGRVSRRNREPFLKMFERVEEDGPTPRYRTKPEEIEAMELENNSDSQEEIVKWCNGIKGPDGGIFVEVLSGIDFQRRCKLYAATGDYIVKGENGQFCPYKRDWFEWIYEKVDD